MIGTIDGVIECGYEPCGGQAMDILRETRGGKWIVECAYCGTGAEVRAVPGHLADRHEEEFRFWGGRFSGKTIDQVAAEPRGLDYIADTAKEHKREAVRKACGTWLAQNRATR